ncbi:MAG: hypothetical protein KGL39_07470 [Patescibacteria group bacterium]|nr:hypothetical protein [Patescibacteria group bacterium]
MTDPRPRDELGRFKASERRSGTMAFMIALLLVAAIGAGFFAGVAYQQKHTGVGLWNGYGSVGAHFGVCQTFVLNYHPEDACPVTIP